MDAVLSPPEAPAMNTPPAPALPPAIDAAPDKPDGLPWAYELPLALRQALPPMKLSMHVWNADPARRFVILDDTRAAEGGPAGKDLTVIEIRREALVLEFRGARFLLPRGGY
jgi:general secretion pathway protein B